MELFLVLIAYSFNYFAKEMFPLKYECGNYIKMAPPRRSRFPSRSGGWRTGARWRTRRGTTWTSGTPPPGSRPRAVWRDARGSAHTSQPPHPTCTTSCSFCSRESTHQTPVFCGSPSSTPRPCGSETRPRRPRPAPRGSRPGPGAPSPSPGPG